MLPLLSTGYIVNYKSYGVSVHKYFLCDSLLPHLKPDEACWALTWKERDVAVVVASGVAVDKYLGTPEHTF